MYKTHAKVSIDSKRAVNGRLGNTHSNYQFRLEEPIQFKKTNDCDYVCKIKNVKYPNSFYQINSNYNTFKVIEDNGITQNTITLTLDQGNYTISELATEIQTLLNANTTQSNTYTINIDTINGKTTFAWAGSSTQVIIESVDNGSTVNPGLGFIDPAGDTSVQYTVASSLESPSVANVNFLGYLEIMTDITTSNNFSGLGRTRTMLRLQLQGDRYDVIVVDNSDGEYLEMSSTSSIKTIQVEVRDQNGKLVEFNGVPNNMEIIFYKYDKYQRVMMK